MTDSKFTVAVKVKFAGFKKACKAKITAYKEKNIAKKVRKQLRREDKVKAEVREAELEKKRLKEEKEKKEREERRAKMEAYWKIHPRVNIVQELEEQVRLF